MVRICIEENCNVRAHFNLDNEKIPLYCKIHKKENMIDIVSRRCLENNCMKRPSFNFEYEKRAVYCKTHKKMK